MSNRQKVQEIIYSETRYSGQAIMETALKTFIWSKKFSFLLLSVCLYVIIMSFYFLRCPHHHRCILLLWSLPLTCSSITSGKHTVF